MRIYHYRWPFLLLFFLAPGWMSGQKYSFFKYNVEEGLVQSQANAFCQDAAHHLWIATVGGISRFDGRQFRNFSQSDGLLYNFSTSLITDRKKGIWVGTTSGLCYFDGNHFTSYPFPDRSGTNYIRMLVQDVQGDLWSLAGRNLYKIDLSGKQVFKQVFADGDSAAVYSTMALDRVGRPWVAVYKKGVYCLDGDKWIRKADLSDNKPFIMKILFDDEAGDRIRLLHLRGILEVVKGQVQAVEEVALKGLEGELVTAGQGPFSDLWIATTKGLYHWADHVLTRFSAANGFTESPVYDIFRDREDNVWFATNGSGIFRYSYEDFTFLDRSQGLGGTLIAGIAEDRRHRIILGVYGDGLYRYEYGRLAKIATAGTGIKKITCIYTRRDGGLIVGTENEGIWEYEQSAGGMDRLRRMDRPGNGLPAFINAMAEDTGQAAGGVREGNYWFATPFGLFHYHDGHTQKIALKSFVNCVLVAGKDSVLAGTPEGLFLIGRDGAPELVKPLGALPVMCMIRKGNILFAGTEDRGVIAWNLLTGRMTIYGKADGLSSDFIYSLLVDGQGDVWAGTGRGINKLVFGFSGGDSGGARVVSYALKGSMTASECSENVVFMRGDRSIWWGTNNGSVIYTPSTVARRSFPSHIVLQKVRLFSQEMSLVASAGAGGAEDPGGAVGSSTKGGYADSITEGYNIPRGLRLAHDSNHLSFEFRGISLANPDGVYYEYMLEGADKVFSDLTPDPFVVYPGLPPGKYRFLVRSYTEGGGYSDNTAAFPFEIVAPFYKTKLFDLLVVMLLIGLTLWIQGYRLRSKARRQRQLEELKQQEQLIVRQRTSEDFHDELGNKLTRISVLTDILQNKLSGGTADTGKILLQIRENVAALYTGTRDILWSLDPASDSVAGISTRLQDFGIELFQETAIQFQFVTEIPGRMNTRLPSDYSRNITMIFKEAMNNTLKHSGCQNAILRIRADEQHSLIFSLEDDGRGFGILDPLRTERRREDKKGYGVNNMEMRAARIHAGLKIFAGPGGGTHVELTIKT